MIFRGVEMVATRQAVRPARPVLPDVIASGAALTVLVVLALWVHGGGVQALTGGGAAAWTAAGRLTGLVSADLLLVQVVLMARVPWIERTYGQDRLVRWHRVVGFTSINLMLAHVVLITVGYAGQDTSPVLAEAWRLVATYPGMLLAVAATAALVMVAVTSVRVARARLRYESWHLLHLYAYLGVGLALPHELWTGADFATPAAQAYWWTMYIACAGCVVAFRVGLPLWRSARHRIRVHSLVAEAPGVFSVYLTGHRLDRLPVRSGQFFNWRFLGRAGWTRAQPYSLSAAPRPDLLRITVKEQGDGSEALRAVRPGTRVLIEGPYGRLTGAARRHRRLTLIASGIGITPLRALLESEYYRPGEATLLYRVRGDEPVALDGELRRLAANRGIYLVYLPGPRGPGGTWLPAGYGDPAQALVRLAPYVARSDVYVCGPEPWMESVLLALDDAMVPREQIHLERFGW
jgi:predicted ferric reductase